MTAALDELQARWRINEFPSFLQSMSASHAAWEVLKLKYSHKILSAAASSDSQAAPTFVISFMGSSVTAGHDSPFNDSFPVQTGNIMAPAFEALGIRLDSRNTAMGNNPCVPYDICPRTYSGLDADIIHWEQSFNCFGSSSDSRHVFEQFIRQSVSSPSKPIVVFSTSDTPNWPSKDCDGKDASATPKLSAEEKTALDHVMHGRTKNVVSEVNKNGPATKPWGAVSNMFKAYQTLAGIQLWDHTSYKAYKCLGPYIAGWQNQGVASWHPSKLGHELRAAHYSYFWLQCLRDAIVEMSRNLTAGQSPESLAAQVKKHQETQAKHSPPAALYPEAGFTDQMQCLTTFEPKWDRDADLLKYVVGGLANSSSSSSSAAAPWTKNIFEMLTDPKIISKAKERGYLDFKHMLYGDKNSLPLSLRFTIGKKGKGTGFLCQPCGNWGRLPKGFANFWEVGTKVYLTRDVQVAAGDSFSFSPSLPKTEELKYTNRKPKDTQTICVDFAPFVFPPGTHVITIVPTSEQKIMISSLLLPSKD